MLKPLNNWLHWGVDAQANTTGKRKVLHTNIGAAIGIASLLGYSALLIAIGHTVMVRVALAEIPFALLFAAIPWLNHKDWNGAARWCLNLTAIGSQIAAILFGVGALFNTHFYFILFAIVPPVFYPLKQWRSIVFLFVLSAGLFLVVELTQLPPSPELLEMKPSVIKLLRALSMSSAFLTMLLIMNLLAIQTERNEQVLEAMSATDVLTQLPNRRFFELVFQKEVAKSQRTHEPLALALLDIDHFKRVNDTFGHDVGDAVLQHIALQLRQATRACTLVARVGGEEFAILMSNTSPAQAIVLAERIRRSIASADYLHAGERLHLTVSIGVAAVPYGSTLAYPYKLVDEALYEAKRTGRNRVVLHSADSPIDTEAAAPRRIPEPPSPAQETC